MIKKYNLEMENGIKYSNVYFIDSLENYKDYMLILNNKVTVSKNEINNLDTFVGHAHGRLTALSGIWSGMIEKKEDRSPMINNLTRIHSEVLIGQMQYLLDDCKLVINSKGGYFPIKPGEKYKLFEIDKEIKKYTEQDIKVDRHFGGTHYYAKIKDIDVVDANYDVKWNTPQRAKEIAIKYMHKLNKE